MSILQNDRGKNIRILFFGRKDCDASNTIVKKLRNYQFEVTYIRSKTRNENLPEYVLHWKGEYIFSFRNLFILPSSLLEKAEFFSINFHPAPPEYPGSGCFNFALYDEVKEYGVTAHIMNEKIDNGKILEVRRFPINVFDNLTSVMSRTHTELLKLCLDFIDDIHLHGKQIIDKKIISSKNEKWNGEARRIKELISLQTISPDISKMELKKIIRATYIKGFPLKTQIHGFNFYLHLDEK